MISKLPNGIIKSSKLLESYFSPNTMKQESWRSEISGIIVKVFDLTNLSGNKVIVIMCCNLVPLLYHWQLFTACFTIGW